MLSTTFDARKEKAMEQTVLEEMDSCPPLKDPEFVSNPTLALYLLLRC